MNKVWKLITHQNYIGGLVMGSQALNASLNIRASGPKPILQSFVAALILGFGGSSLVAILLNQSIDFLQSNAVFMWYLGLAIFLNKAPNSIVIFINKFKFVFSFFSLITTAISIFRGVDRVRDLPKFHSSVFTMIFAGTLSGCGGSILASAFNLLHSDWRLLTPGPLIKLNFGLKSCFFASFFYIFFTLENAFITDKFGLTEFMRVVTHLDRETAKIFVGFIFVFVMLMKSCACKLWPKKQVKLAVQPSTPIKPILKLPSPSKEDLIPTVKLQVADSIPAVKLQVADSQNMIVEKKNIEDEVEIEEELKKEEPVRRRKKISSKTLERPDESPRPRSRRLKKE